MLPKYYHTNIKHTSLYPPLPFLYGHGQSLVPAWLGVQTAQYNNVLFEYANFEVSAGWSLCYQGVWSVLIRGVVFLG